MMQFRDVHFAYPSRPDQPVLRGVTITAEPGQVRVLAGWLARGRFVCRARASHM